jgi:hypothetical protein
MTGIEGYDGSESGYDFYENGIDGGPDGLTDEVIPDHERLIVPDQFSADPVRAEYEADLRRRLLDVDAIDPALLDGEHTRQLVEFGILSMDSITNNYGTPDRPRWASGACEQGVMMSFHNGGKDGHTSVGPLGAGVPRNVLRIARAVNEAAGYEVCDPKMRAEAFVAGGRHDEVQLNGRSLLPEGQGSGRGDERMSAERARDSYIAAGGNPDTAQRIYNNTVATAYNPDTSAQNVQYEVLRRDPHNPAALRDVLGQELTTTADLLGAITERGRLGAIEYTIESLCLKQNGSIVQERLRAQGIEPASIISMQQMLEVVDQDPILREIFVDATVKEVKFVRDHLSYSDRIIRKLCGKGIDQLFPGRQDNVTRQVQYLRLLQENASSVSIWQKARQVAGY